MNLSLSELSVLYWTIYQWMSISVILDHISVDVDQYYTGPHISGCLLVLYWTTYLWRSTSIILDHISVDVDQYYIVAVMSPGDVCD